MGPRLVARPVFDLRVIALVAATAVAACGHAKNSESRTRATTTSSQTDEVVLIATERSDRGGRLVGVAADGKRLGELTQLHGKVVLDRSPVVTPDGNWIVFASNRRRGGLSDTKLWRITSRGDSLLALTEGSSVDRDPRLSPDGRWLYFCSNRGGSFDLYRAPFDLDEGTIGQANLVAESEGQILSPTISPDGSQVAFMEVSAEGESQLWRAPVDGTAEKRALTDGPADMTPAWGPRDQIAFASRVPGRDDADIYLMPADGGERTMLLDTTVTDETGPRWSKDGRYIFAIGMYRSATDGKPLLGSVIALDRKEQVPTWRALHDPAVVETRIGLGLLPTTINAEVLHGNQSYKKALSEVLTREARRNESRQSRGGQ